MMTGRVKYAASLLVLSGSLSIVVGHAGYHEIQVRTSSSCSTTFNQLNPGAYPAPDCVPFVEDTHVQAWLKQVDLTKAPSYEMSRDGDCSSIANVPSDQCWWTCQKCVAPSDIVACPTVNTLGLTYDDGPSEESPRLYDHLLDNNQKATLFIVGSRVINYPETLKRAYNEGHHIAIHTWSHQSMTSLTNEQIVAELKWTEKAIFDVIGVAPLYWRPPYGDIDNRVRYIATQLGYKTVIWTTDFDTNDWKISPDYSAQNVIDTFKTFLTRIPSMNTGFIVLEHDLQAPEVDVAIHGILPLAYANKNLNVMPVAQCLGDGRPYREGAGTFVLGGPPAAIQTTLVTTTTSITTTISVPMTTWTTTATTTTSATTTASVMSTASITTTDSSVSTAPSASTIASSRNLVAPNDPSASTAPSASTIASTGNLVAPNDLSAPTASPMPLMGKNSSEKLKNTRASNGALVAVLILAIIAIS